MDCGPAKETPGIVRGMCEGKAACQLEAKHKLLQNPESRHCPGKWFSDIARTVYHVYMYGGVPRCSVAWLSSVGRLRLFSIAGALPARAERTCFNFCYRCCFCARGHAWKLNNI